MRFFFLPFLIKLTLINTYFHLNIKRKENKKFVSYVPESIVGTLNI